MGSQKLNFDSLTAPGDMPPKDIFLLQYFINYNYYVETCLKNCRSIDERVDTAVGLLVATCPDKTTQNVLFKEYEYYCKEGYGNTTAAAFTIGSLLSYVDETMELTDKPFFTDSGYGGKPRVAYLMEVDTLLQKYNEDVVNALPTAEDRIDAGTALIIARYPDKVNRERLWHDYIENKKTKSQINSSVLAAADLFTLIANEFDMTSVAYMGF
jgi:hypothetical protein